MDTTYVSLLLDKRTSLTYTQVFLNIVLDEAVEEKDGGEKVRLGMVVGCRCPSCRALLIATQVIRGNSVVMLEALERIGGDDRHHR